MEGKAEGSNGTGVKGTGRHGVWGESNQAGFRGVADRNNATDGVGVRGEGLSGTGVRGNGRIGVWSSDPNGVYGTSSTAGPGAGYGLHGAGNVVAGRCDGGYGVWGKG